MTVTSRAPLLGADADAGTPPSMSARLPRQGVVAAFVISFALLLITQWVESAHDFLGDAGAYWYLSSTIWNMTFPETIRGYFYPLILSPVRLLQDALPGLGYLPLRVFNSGLYAFVLTVALPGIFLRLLYGRDNVLRRIIPTALFCSIFPGIVSYPLTDLPALCFLSLSVWLLLHIGSASTLGKRHTALALLAGILAYGSYNTRPVYIFSFGLLTLISLFALSRDQRTAAKVRLAVAFMVGACICALPQMAVNYKHRGSASPLVLTNRNDTSLFAVQLRWGITLQRYETGVHAEQRKVFPIYYLDRSGEIIFAAHDINASPTTITEYVKLVLSEPMQFAALYGRHLINGLDARDGVVYTSSLSADKWMRSLAILAIALAGIASLLGAIRVSAQRWRKVLWLSPFLVPVLAILPGAVETRFFVPLQALIYNALAFHSAELIAKARQSRHLVSVGIAFCAALALFFHVAQNSLQRPINVLPPAYLGDWKR